MISFHVNDFDGISILMLDDVKECSKRSYSTPNRKKKLLNPRNYFEFAFKTAEHELIILRNAIAQMPFTFP